MPERKGKSVRLICQSCKSSKKTDSKFILKEKLEKTKRIEAVDVEVLDTMPKVKAECPKCGHLEAYFRTEQTRAADEPETEFYTCTKCGKVWREYQ